MVWFKRYKYHPNKHYMMPNEYPWQVTTIDETFIQPENGYEITEEGYDNLINSIDLTDYRDEITKEIIQEKIKYYQSNEYSI